MSIKDRKEREKEDMRNLIIGAANDIIHKEGLEKLSIRKITDKIEYSPAIIYHYFKNKEEIINCIMKIGYGKFLNVLASVQDYEISAEEKFEKSLRGYIKTALEMPDEYKIVMLNSSKKVLEHTSTLFKGASKKRQALNALHQYIKDNLKGRDISDTTVELAAQLVFTSTFGLIIRILIERDTPNDQQDILIEYHIKFILNGIRLFKGGIYSEK